MSSSAVVIVALLAWAGFWFLLGWALCKTASHADSELERLRYKPEPVAPDLRYVPTPEGVRYAARLQAWRDQ